jgi:hypothetical protein
MFGAGEGNRTLVISLEGCVTIKYFRNLAAKLCTYGTNRIKWLCIICKTGFNWLALAEAGYSASFLP